MDCPIFDSPKNRKSRRALIAKQRVAENLWIQSWLRKVQEETDRYLGRSDESEDDFDDEPDVKEDTLELLRSQAPVVRTLFSDAWYYKKQGRAAIQFNLPHEKSKCVRNDDDGAVIECSPGCNHCRVENDTVENNPEMVLEDADDFVVAEDEDDTLPSEAPAAASHEHRWDPNCWRCVAERLREEKWDLYSQLPISAFIDEEGERERRRKESAKEQVEEKTVGEDAKDNYGPLDITRVFSHSPSNPPSQTNLSNRHPEEASVTRRRVFFRPSETSNIYLPAAFPPMISEASLDLPPLFSPPPNSTVVMSAVSIPPTQASETVVSIASTAAFANSERGMQYHIISRAGAW